ncbi:MAG: hypothetical protein HN617_18555 [Planctomycetaceae bacterium]|nr:hypothetical protein [Planctomycetaceae bacterium]
MNNIKLPTTTIGKRIESDGLSVFPLYLKIGLKTVVKSGLEMIDEGLVNVKEVSDAGSVPTLCVTNNSPCNVLFVEGDQLVGAKQNRICNSTVLIAPKSFAEIPVSCVEQGRWARKSAAFSTSNNAATPEMRKILKESKREAREAYMLQQQASQSEEPGSMAREQAAVHHASQGAVWEKVETMQYSHAASSHTNSMEDVFESKRGLIERALKTLIYPQNARGWIIAINGDVQTIEMFAKKKLCKKAWDRVMRGCVLETMGKAQRRQLDKKGEQSTPSRVKEQQILRALDRLSKLSWERVVAVSAGEEYRGDEGSLIGSQLRLDGRLVHLSAVV